MSGIEENLPTARMQRFTPKDHPPVGLSAAMHYLKNPSPGMEFSSPTRGTIRAVASAGRRVLVGWENGEVETYSEERFIENAKRVAAIHGDAVTF